MRFKNEISEIHKAVIRAFENFIKVHEGEINLQINEGEDTPFTISLPF